MALLGKFLAEVGLSTLYRSTLDVKLLCLQRFVRLFAYGASTLVLVSYLRELHVSQTRIGLFMTLTLVGDVAISFVLSLVADALGRRRILVLGAMLMVGSGVVFASVGNYWLLLTAAILGVISPSGNEIGPFRAIEESIVAHVTTPETRSDIYAWYSLSGNGGTAFGMMTCGWAVHALHKSGLDTVQVYRYVFYGYAAAGVVKALLALCLGPAVEADRPTEANSVETTPLLRNDDNQKPSWLSRFGSEGVTVMVTLCALFAIDSFASGLASLSWVTYLFKSRYHLEEGRLGTVFFVTSIISAASTIVASSLAKRFGNVKTMVFTHLPSAICLALIPIPRHVELSLTFLILRACTQSMDVAPRSAFLAAILQPAQRTAAMGLINVTKTTAQSVGPLVTGVLADSSFFWVAFVAAGCLKAGYDLGLLALFKHRDGRERVRDEAA